MSRFKLQIVQKLIPGLRKDGYTEELSTTDTTTNPQRDIPQPVRPQPQAPPRAPEYDPSHIPPENPLSIGRRDLDPFPGMNPSNPFAPPALFPPYGNDGMFVGPDHPIFGDRGRGGQGRWGGDGFLPPMGAPPGARFDPIAPGIVPFGPGAGGRGGRGGGPLGGGNLHDPDNDEFMPPGAVSIVILDLRCLDTNTLFLRVRVICSCDVVVIVRLDSAFPSHVTCTIGINAALYRSC
jgi:proteasome inhibitor subunit 1 (PI31)